MLRSCIVKVAILLAAGVLITPEAIALTAAASSGTVNQQNTAQPAWPRNYELDGYEIQLYQPEALTWDGRRMTGRAAFVIGVPNQTPHYGFAYFSAATRTDMPGASVVLTDIRFGRVEIPIAPDQEGRVRTRLFEQFSGHGLSLPLPLVQASIAAAARPPAPQEAALPPRIVFADQLTILIPIAGAPIMRPVSGVTGFERVINTEAMLLRDIAATYHLQAGGSWFEASDLTGPWVPTIEVPADVIAAAKAADASQQADPLLPQDGKPISPPPAILLSTVPTELIQTDGPAKMGPVGGTSLMTIENADHAVFVAPSTRTTYVLISGRWFSAPGQSGPWTYVAGADLPAAFSRISPEDPKASVLISVPGTPQAREAAIAATIPAMAMIKTSATATASYDGAPQFAPIEGTSLRYAVNSAEPVIQVAPKQNYMVSQGVWFTAPAATGPWTVARTVPDAIYAIPPSSPVHYVTGVRVYGVAPQGITVGYTPVYMGVGLGPGGTVVYGTGYPYAGYTGTRWLPGPATYGFGAGFSLGTTGFGYGFSPGWSWGAGVAPHWGAYAGATPFGRGWGFANVGVSNIYGRWGAGAVVGTGWGGISIGASAWSRGTWGGIGAGIGGVGVGVGVGFGASGSFGGFSAYGGHYMSQNFGNHFNTTNINNNTTNINQNNTNINSNNTTQNNNSQNTNENKNNTNNQDGRPDNGHSNTPKSGNPPHGPGPVRPGNDGDKAGNLPHGPGPVRPGNDGDKAGNLPHGPGPVRSGNDGDKAGNLPQGPGPVRPGNDGDKAGNLPQGPGPVKEGSTGSKEDNEKGALGPGSAGSNESNQARDKPSAGHEKPNSPKSSTGSDRPALQNGTEMDARSTHQEQRPDTSDIGRSDNRGGDHPDRDDNRADRGRADHREDGDHRDGDHGEEDHRTGTHRDGDHDRREHRSEGDDKERHAEHDGGGHHDHGHHGGGHRHR